MKRIEKVAEAVSKLQDLEDSQMEIALLRSCLALPKMAFSLRCCPPSHIQQAVSAFDHLMRSTLGNIAGSPLTEWAWLKATLPSSSGGLNIRQASLHAPAAYISSLCLCRDLITRILGQAPVPSQHMSASVFALAVAANRPDWSSLEDINVPCRARPLSSCIDEASLNLLLSSAPDLRSKALAHSTALPHAGDWLNVIPSATFGLHLQDWEFRLCLQYWLGLRMSEEGTCCSICQGPSDAFGDHKVGCGVSLRQISQNNF